MRMKNSNGVSSPKAWHSAMASDRLARAEHLRLPSGATILAVRPDPLEWILSGRIPQHLLGAALEAGPTLSGGADREMTREEILELAAFARQLVKASVVKPAIGEGPDEIALDDIPIQDRAFIFEWACRALGNKSGVGSRQSGVGQEPFSSPTPNSQLPTPGSAGQQEGLSSEKLERFRQE
jgi:hypothetical protein